MATHECHLLHNPGITNLLTYSINQIEREEENEKEKKKKKKMLRLE